MLAGMTILPFALIFFFTLAVLRFLIPVARRAGYVDRPGGRKAHKGTVPPIGGRGIMPVFALALMALSLLDRGLAGLRARLAVIFVMRAYADLRQVGPWVIFTVQCLVAFFLVVIGGAEVRQLVNLCGMGDVGLGIFSIPFSIAAFVLLLNALNMM